MAACTVSPGGPPYSRIPKLVPPGRPKKAAEHATRAPIVASSDSVSLASVSLCATKKATGGCRKEDRGRDERQKRSAWKAQGEVSATSPQSSIGEEALDAVRASSVGRSASISPDSVSSRVAKKAAKGRKKEGGGGDERQKRAAWQAQGGATMTINQSSVGSEASGLRN